MPEFTDLEIVEQGETVRIICPRLSSELVQELLGVGCHSVSWGPDRVSFLLGAADVDRFRAVYEAGGHVTLDVPFRVLAYYDYISPFAYVSTELVKHVEATFNIHVEWRGFELRPLWSQYPDVTTDPVRSQARWAMQKDTARRWGLPIAENRPPFRLRTRTALMASEYAKENGHFREFQRAMYNAYYVTHEDIRDLTVISRIAEGLGLNGTELVSSVLERRYEPRMEQWRREAEADLVFGVPTFKVGATVIWGREAFDDLSEALEAAGAQRRT
jgi:2-hydroxychromene-2-carboxylate isomerase